MQQKQQLDGEKILKQTGREICNLHVEGKPQHGLRRPAESPLTQQQDIIPCNCWGVNKITLHVSPVLCLRFHPYHEGTGGAPSPLLALHLGTGSFKPLSPPSHRGRPPGDVEGNFYLLSRPLMTQRRNCLLFFSFLFFLVCSPQYLFVRDRQEKKKKKEQKDSRRPKQR